MTACCPMCRRPTSVPGLDDLISSRRISGHGEAILTALWDARGEALPSVRIFDAMYADDPDGGPSNTQAYQHLAKALQTLERALSGSGVMVERTTRGTLRLKITGT